MLLVTVARISAAALMTCAYIPVHQNPALSQPSDVSPVAPPTLSRPVFDTVTPVYSLDTGKDGAAQSVVAEVEGRTIVLGDVGDAIRVMHKPGADMPFDELYPGVVGMLIKKQALVLRAQQNGQDEDPDTKRRMKAAAEDVLTSAYIDRIAKKRITEQVLLDRYALDYVGKPAPAAVRLRIILTPTEQEAQAVIAELKAGTDFTALARRASHDASRSNGGDVGYQPREALLPEIAAVAFALQPGQTTAYPVHIADGWCIVRVEDRHQTSQPTFASVRERLLALLVHELFQNETEDALSTFKVRTFSISGREKESEEPK